MKKILLSLVVLALLGAGTGYYLWNKPHENMETRKVDTAVDATQFFQEFNTDETAANAKYLDKAVAVTGAVREVTKSDDGKEVKVILSTGSEFGVVCVLDPLSHHDRTDFAVGEKVTFKGLCSGLNFDIQLDRCVEMR